jgi:hypothetical protein
MGNISSQSLVSFSLRDLPLYKDQKYLKSAIVVMNFGEFFDFCNSNETVIQECLGIKETGEMHYFSKLPSEIIIEGGKELEDAIQDTILSNFKHFKYKVVQPKIVHFLIKSKFPICKKSSEGEFWVRYREKTDARLKRRCFLMDQKHDMKNILIVPPGIKLYKGKIDSFGTHYFIPTTVAHALKVQTMELLTKEESKGTQPSFQLNKIWLETYFPKTGKAFLEQVEIFNHYSRYKNSIREVESIEFHRKLLSSKMLQEAHENYKLLTFKRGLLLRNQLTPSSNLISYLDEIAHKLPNFTSDDNWMRNLESFTKIPSSVEEGTTLVHDDHIIKMHLSILLHSRKTRRDKTINNYKIQIYFKLKKFTLF